VPLDEDAKGLGRQVALAAEKAIQESTVFVACQGARANQGMERFLGGTGGYHDRKSVRWWRSGGSFFPY
jgi:hypothetical protein